MKRQPNSWLIFFSLALQIGALMYLSIRLGTYLDKKAATSTPWFTLGLAIVAMIAVIRLIVHQTKKL